jgi:DNA modification methylase
VTVYYTDDAVTLYHGDCIEVMRSLPSASVDAVVTDPPYGLEFMGKEWDAPWKENGRWNDKPHGEDNQRPTDENGVSTGLSRWTTPRPSFAAGLPFQQWCQLWATECLRVLKPGGHMLAFGGTRTWHRLACAVEDAGFEVRDSIAWLHGQGFPKSLDVSKAIDKAAGAEREVVGAKTAGMGSGSTFGMLQSEGDNSAAVKVLDITAPATPDAQAWQGWGTALKPAFEPIVVGRKPLAGSVAANVLAHGTGALNIDACRVGDEVRYAAYTSLAPASGNRLGAEGTQEARRGTQGEARRYEGRWPANVALDESQAAALDAQSGALTSGTLAAHHQRSPKDAGILGAYGSAEGERGYGDTGGASRFFYVAKADRNERPKVDGVAHPTVKPLDLMRWLVRLVTPPGGTVLEPFAGSGTTVEACIIEGFQCIAIEKGDEHLPLIESRITRRRDPVRHVELTGADPGLFDFLGGEAS